MNILLLKDPKGSDDPYAVALKELGTVHFIPVLSIRLMNIAQLENLLHEVDFTNIIFTSGNAVKAMKRVFESTKPETLSKWTQAKCYVVGKATQKLANELGFKCHGSNSGNASDLAKIIIQENSANQNETFLFPCGQMKRETLPTLLKEAGLKFTSIIVYETTEHPDIFQEVSRHKTLSTGMTIAVFFSPSGVNFALEKLRTIFEEDLKNFHFAAIGRTAADALEKKGVIPCCVAGRPTPEDLAESITVFLNSKQD